MLWTSSIFLRELCMHHGTIRYCIQAKVRSHARMCDVNIPIQSCHTLDYEENNSRTKKRNKMDIVFFSRGRSYATWHAGKTNTFKDISQKLGLYKQIST